MQRWQKESLIDNLVVWGFVLTIAAFMGAGFYEVCKIVSVIPAAFESAPALPRNPMWASDGDDGANQGGGNGTTARQRAQEFQRAEEQGR